MMKMHENDIKEQMIEEARKQKNWFAPVLLKAAFNPEKA